MAKYIGTEDDLDPIESTDQVATNPNVDEQIAKQEKELAAKTKEAKSPVSYLQSPAGVIAGIGALTAVATATYALGKKSGRSEAIKKTSPDYLTGENKFDPTFEPKPSFSNLDDVVNASKTPQMTNQARTLEQAQAMARQAMGQPQIDVNAPTPSVFRIHPDRGISPQAPVNINVPPTVQAPTAPAAGTQPPMGALTEAVATGQNATKAVQADVAAMVDKTPAPEIVKTGTGRELIVGQGAEGGRFKTTYGAPQDVPAGYAFYPGGGVVDTLRQGLGQELFTKEFQVGNRPLPASIEEARNLIKDIKVAYNIPSREQLKAEGKPLPEQPKGIMRSKVTPTGESKGVIPVEVGGQKGTLMPKGKAQLGAGLPGMLSVLGLLGLSQTKDAKAAMEKASKAIKDIGISPDIMLRNPEEIGSLGRAYVTAGNPVYIRELSEQLATERDPDRRLMLTQEIIKAGGAVPPMR